MKPNNFIPVKSASRSAFFRTWVEVLTPWHKLAPRERDVFARILEQYYILRKKVDDPELIAEFLWTNASRKDMRESLGVSRPHFQLMLTALRRQGVLEGDKINPRYLPHLSEDPNLGLYIFFDWSTKNNPVSENKQD